MVETAKSELDQVGEDLDELHTEFDDLEPPEMEVPEPEVDEDAQPTPWFDSDDDFVAASLRLKNIKALDSRTLGRRVRLDDRPVTKHARPAPKRPEHRPRVQIEDDEDEDEEE